MARGFLLALVFASVAWAQAPVPSADVQGRLLIEKTEGATVDVPTPAPNITSAYAGSRRLDIEFNKDATSVRVLLGDGKADGRVTLDTADKSIQYSDGTIIFSALDAKVDGKVAKLESHPGNHRIGFWSRVEDTVSWDYKATRPGTYAAELTYSLATGESVVAFDYAGTKIEAKLKPTGSWYRYTTIPLGKFYVEKAGKQRLKVRPVSKIGGAVMNLKAVTLRPAAEGKPVVVGDDGVIELDAGCATTHGVLLQYERNPRKLCLGYWTKEKEWASWDFDVAKPGAYTVELTQGCGKGHGGSKVDVLVGGKALAFTVEDTGGFQNWKVRKLGTVTFDKAGPQRIEVRPKTKPGVAVMDIRRIRLVPN